MSAKLTTNVDQRLLRTTRFPAEFNTKVDMKKVNIHIIKKWVSDELARLLNGEDDVVTELVFNIIEENRFPNIKELQVQLSGFLDKDAASFCHELWKLCLSAQSNPQGIPKELLEAKKSELMQERIEEERAREEATRRQNAERDREREVERIRDRERNERRGRGGGGRFGRDSDRRPRRDSRSPPPRRRRDDDDFSRPTRAADTWVPNRRDDRAPRRRPSPDYGRAPDRSRSPPRRRRRSSTPPSSRSRSRRRRNTSSDGSASPDRRRRKGGRDRSRSPRRRSPPPSKRQRRRSPSPAASQGDGAVDSRPNSSSSTASAQKDKRSSAPAQKDLMSTFKTNNGKDGRLSQELEEYSSLGAAKRAQDAAEIEIRASKLKAELLRRREQGLWNSVSGSNSRKR